MAGRPEKITHEIVAQIATAIRAGNYMEAAAAYAGISKDTLYRWLRRGARELQRLSKNNRFKLKSSELLYVSLSEAIQKATADSEVRDVSIISKAAAGGHEYTETKVVYNEKGHVVQEIRLTKKVPPQWQAAAWRLERKNPERWGRNASAFAPQEIPQLVIEEVPMGYGMDKKADDDLDDDLGE